MEDVRNTYRINEKSELGDVHISDDVLAVISAMAALEVDGVVGMAGNITSEIVGVRVVVAEGSVQVDVSIIIRMNEQIIEVSMKVQDRVKTTVENMTGLKVENVNVNISSVLSK